MITRRNFLKAGAAVAALSVVPNGFASILAKKEKAIGVQLYSCLLYTSDAADE